MTSPKKSDLQTAAAEAILCGQGVRDRVLHGGVRGDEDLSRYFLRSEQIFSRSKQIFSKICANIFMAGGVQVWGDEWEDLVPAVRGTCLREAISGVCERRGVSRHLVELQTNLREV